MTGELEIIAAFSLPIIWCDDARHIQMANEHFIRLFGDHTGAPLSVLSNGFVAKKFEREVETDKGHSFRIIPVAKTRAEYYLTMRRQGEGFIGLVSDRSALARTEAMLASYSALIEEQNREIKHKTAQIEIWRSRIETELEQAAVVQDLLVPQSISTPHLISRCQYLREMSGDFHEMIKLPDNSTIALVGDVAGKGIYAAIMLAQTLTAFRASCHLGSLPTIVAGMIEMLDDRFPDGLFVALSLVHQSADRQKVDVLNLGNPPALVVSGTTIIQQIESVGPAIGILPASFYETLSVTRLSLTGCHLLVYSDGLIDINLGEDMPDLVDSSDIASHILPLLDLDSQAPFDRLFESLNQHPQSDDIVITCLRS